MTWFPMAEIYSMNLVLEKALSVMAVVFDEKGKGEYAVFLAECEGEHISFLTSAKILVSTAKKILSSMNYSIVEQQKVYLFNDVWPIRIIEKQSKNGNKYLDYEHC